MHIVFTIPELLEKIFSNLSSKEIKPIVTVNQRWSASALDVLWVEVGSVWQICHVLAPMVRDSRTGEYGFSFTRRLTPADWSRLDRYAGHVQRLQYSPWPNRHLASTIFDELARARLRMDIFPNLREVSWNFRPLDSLVFLHEGVRRFTIELAITVVQEEVTVFFSHLASRSPHLAELHIKRVQCDVRIVDAPLTSAFESFLELRAVSLPFTPSKGVWDMLARLPALQSLAVGNSTNTPPDITFADHAFPSLERITLSFSYDRSSSILTQVKLPSLLNQIYINSPVKESPASLTGLLTVISTRFPDLIALGVISVLQRGPRSQTETMALDSLRPLLRCSKLRSFEVSHSHALLLSPSDIEVIAAALPYLERLILNCSPPEHHVQCQMGISELGRFARLWPNLQHLGLYLDASSPPSQMSRSIFSNLQSLYVGTSVLSNVHSTASFLSYICPYVKTVVAGRCWIHPAPDDNGLVDKRWKDVGDLLPLLSSIRAEERALARRNADHQLAGLDDFGF